MTGWIYWKDSISDDPMMLPSNNKIQFFLSNGSLGMYGPILSIRARKVLQLEILFGVIHQLASATI